MKKFFTSICVIGALITAKGQNAETKETRPNGWKKRGNIGFTFNQSAFSNWTAGGANSFNANITGTYEFNYKKDKLTWDNLLIGDYGVSRILTGDNRQLVPAKTNDRIEFTSTAGKQIKESNWYGSFITTARSQFDAGYLTSDQEGEMTFDNTIDSRRFTEFLSPLYIQFGPGFLWKKNDNLKVNIAPASSRFIIVDGKFTDPSSRYQKLTDGAYFGVDANETLRYELGAAIDGYYKLNIMKNISLENILGLYSNYLQEWANVDINYTANVVMHINKYMSTNLTFQAIYDDNASKNFQIREVFGLGINFGF